MTTDPELPVVPEDLAELRRNLDVGLVRVDGRLELLAHRAEQTAREQADLTFRVTNLEHSRWPLPAVAALTAIGALAVAIWQALGH